jgi:hypothetical protein
VARTDSRRVLLLARCIKLRRKLSSSKNI